MISTVVPESAILSLSFSNIRLLAPCIEYEDLILNLLKQKTKSTLTTTTKTQTHFNPPLHGQPAPLFRVF